MKLRAFVTGHRVPPTRHNGRGTGKLVVAARSERCNTDAEISWTKVLRYAGCAFEAYADLDQKDVHLPRLTPNATSISYLDAEYLESAFEGVVKVEVLSAKLVGGSKTWWNPLSGIDAFKGDPFVKVTMDGGTGRTETMWGNPNPEFDDRIYLYVRERSSSRMVFYLMDDNVTVAGREIGKALVMTGTLEEGRRQAFELPIGTSGTTLSCAVTYAPLRDNALIEDLVLAEEDLSESDRRLIRKLFASSVGVLSSRWRAANGGSLTPVAFIENEDSDTQAWVFWDRQSKEVVVSFRGTEQTEWKDVLSDLNLLPTNVWYEEGRLQKSDSTIDDNEMWVHRGFFEAFMSIAAEVREVVGLIASNEPGEWTLCTTGHSLGGALSTLAAYELASKSNDAGGKFRFKSVENYNFGSPMVGNSAFRDSFDALVPECYRVANAKDAVTFVPRLIGFAHVGKRVTLEADGSARFDDQTADVGDGITSERLIKQMTAAKIEELKKLAGDQLKQNIDDAVEKLLPTLSDSDGDAGDQLKQNIEDAVEKLLPTLSDLDGDAVDIDQILEAEKEALLGLIEGEAVEEHMEDVYWERLKDRVLASG